LAYGEGTTLQDAADDLVARVLALVMAFRSGGGGIRQRRLNAPWELVPFAVAWPSCLRSSTSPSCSWDRNGLANAIPSPSRRVFPVVHTEAGHHRAHAAHRASEPLVGMTTE
jgi:hypothetical protein